MTLSIHYQIEVKRQEEMQIETQMQLMRIQNERYIYQLCIDGEFSYEPNRVIVHEMQIDYISLIQHIALYNEFNNDKKVTMEQVLEEYENFCNGEGGTEALDAVLHFDFGNHNLTLDIHIVHILLIILIILWMNVDWIILQRLLMNNYKRRLSTLPKGFMRR